MKVLVVGSGGREHTLIWKLKQSKKVDNIFCAPGNGGISKIAKCVNIKADNIRALADFAARNKIHLTVVGPEAPLAAGIADEFTKRKLKVFAPDKSASQLESSKVFSKEFMRKYHIPTAAFKVFTTAAEAIGFCRTVEYPVVIKADGLAAGKGAVVVKNAEQATATIENMMIKKQFGSAGDTILVESFLQGQEISVMALTDGKTIVPLLASQDHKQAFDGDRGPNTGGMGAYCPTGFATDEIMTRINDYVLAPTLSGLNKEGITYKGVLYAGYELMMAVVNRKLASIGQLSWRNDSAACVVMASKGYPGNYTTGVKIGGLPNKDDNNCVVFHAGTVYKNSQYMTSGGRVLGVVGLDKNLQLALNRAYRTVNKIKFEGARYRKDIGFRVLNLKRK